MLLVFVVATKQPVCLRAFRRLFRAGSGGAFQENRFAGDPAGGREPRRGKNRMEWKKPPERGECPAPLHLERERTGARATACWPARRSAYAVYFALAGGWRVSPWVFPFLSHYPVKNPSFVGSFRAAGALRTARLSVFRRSFGSAFRETPAVFALIRVCPGCFVFWGGVARSRAAPPSLLRTLKVFS